MWVRMGDDTAQPAPIRAETRELVHVPGVPFSRGYDPRRHVRPIKQAEASTKLLRGRIREWSLEIADELRGIVQGAEKDADRVAAAKILLAYAHGNPVTRVQVGNDEEPPARMDLSKLTIEELRALDVMMKKAQP